MVARVDLTFDCTDPGLVAEFWKTALGYVDEPPPAPFSTREEWLARFDPEGGSADDGAWLCDPEGVGPRLPLQRATDHIRPQADREIGQVHRLAPCPVR